MAQTVGELGESGVLQRVLSRLSVADAAVLGPGDDCAVLSVRGELVVTTDTMIEGPDFRAAWHGGFELGWKLAATNLSDVAAMGARPTALTLALAVPRDTPVSLLEQIAEGMTAACRTLAPGCGVVGGDLGTAPVITAAVTALGELADRPAVTRSGARAGDRIAYAGELGLAGMGLSLLFAAAADEDGIADPAPMAELWETQPEILSAQLAPTPPIPLGIAAAAAGASAMMDVSDSLSIDAHRMARASEVRLDLSSARLSEAFGVQQGVAVPIEAMLSGGEDHGLLATFPPTAELPHGFSVIGEVSPAALPGHGDSSGLLLDGAPVAPSGWDPYVVRWLGA